MPDATHSTDLLPLLRQVTVAADRLLQGWAEGDEGRRGDLWRGLAAATEAAYDVVYPLPAESVSIAEVLDQSTEERRSADDAMDKVIRAWSVEGPRPDFHRAQQQRLRAEWPTLATAVEALTNVRLQSEVAAAIAAGRERDRSFAERLREQLIHAAARPVPDRIGIDAQGFGWRAWDGDDHLSMVPTNPDNEPIPEPMTWFVPERVEDPFRPTEADLDAIRGDILPDIDALRAYLSDEPSGETVAYGRAAAERLVGDLNALASQGSPLSEGLRAAVWLVQKNLLGDGGCVIAAFDERLGDG